MLSACHYAPNAFRVAGPADLVVISWEHAGAIPPRWDLGAALAHWSGGVLGEVNVEAVRALFDGYAAEADVPHPLDLGAFSAAVCAGLNWLASRIKISLTESDTQARDLASRAVPSLLADPPSRRDLEAVLGALG